MLFAFLAATAVVLMILGSIGLGHARLDPWKLGWALAVLVALSPVIRTAFDA